MSGSASFESNRADRLIGRSGTWRQAYVRHVALADFGAAIVAVAVAVGWRFGSDVADKYLVLTVLLPPLWMLAVRVAGGYEIRFLGTGLAEFRRVLSAGAILTSALVLVALSVNNELSRAYLAISMSGMVTLDMLARFALRKRLHSVRERGQCMSPVVAVGHAHAVEQIVRELRRQPYRGLEVVAACLAEKSTASEVAGVPVIGDLDATANVVRNVGAGAVAVLSCPEMDGIEPRTLAWELEKTRTDLYVAPALLQVAGPRTTIRPTAELTLLHVDDLQLSGPRKLLSDLLDRMAVLLVLLLLSPLMPAIAVAITIFKKSRRRSLRSRLGRTGAPVQDQHHLPPRGRRDRRTS